MSLHRAQLVSMAQQHRWIRGAELGVDKGILFRMLLEGVPGLTLIGVDTFPDRERSRRAFETAERYADRARLHVMPTVEAAAERLDGEFDFVFIDADHSYDAVMQDIAHWQPKVRPGGWLGGHDYHPRKFPGVVKAVDRAFGRSVEHYDGMIWGVWQ